MTETAEDPWDIRPPSWMSRAQKDRFRTLIEARRAADDPLSASEIDSLADYVSARSRAAELQKMWKRSAAEANNPHGYLDGRRALTFARQIDATAKLSRRLAAMLRI